MKIKAFLILIIFILPVLVYAQEAWTLEMCIEYAVENSPKVNTSQAKSEIRLQDQRESVASLFPSFSASIDGSFNFGRGIGDDNVYTNTQSFSNGYGIGGSLTIFDGLSSIYKVKMNKVANLQGKQQLQIAKDEVALGTIESFFLVQGYGEMVELCRQQLEESMANLEQTEKMAEVGLKGFPDVAEMQAQLAASQYRLTQQENILKISLIQLKEKMNFPLDAEIAIIPFDDGPTLLTDSESPMEIYAYASENNPVALSARMQEDYSRYNYKATKGNLFPSIWIGGGYNTGFYRNMKDGSNYESFWNQLSNKRGHYVNFGMNIPLFSGLSRQSNVKRAALNMRIARNDSEETMRKLYSEIEQALADVNGQADEYKEVTLRTEAASLSYELSLRKYNEGLISAVELHTSSNRLLEARADATSSLLMYHLKRKLLDYYKGIPFYTAK